MIADLDCDTVLSDNHRASMTEAPAEFRPDSAPQARRSITDVAAWLAAQDHNARTTLQTLGELLVGIAEQADNAEDADEFTARCLGVTDSGQLLNEERPLHPLTQLSTALALAQWIDEPYRECEVGPGEHTAPPSWTQTEIGGQCYRHPLCLRAHFPAGTLAQSGVVIGIETRDGVLLAPHVSVYVTPEDQTLARSVLDRLAQNAYKLNPYRGRMLRAAGVHGLTLSVSSPCPSTDRTTIIVPEHVWAEVDLAVAAVRDRYDLLNRHGLGTRRGLLLCGPPGTGKSAVSAVVANEVLGDFTVIYVDAKAGANLLTAVVEEAQHLGGPILLILEDIDLWSRHRTAANSAGLPELLAAMDIQPSARILTLASTNDTANLDSAVIRTGRFDSVVEIGYPTRINAARILAALTRDLPGGETVDVDAVAAALPEHTSGSDIREIARRGVIASRPKPVSTPALLAEIGNGPYRAQAPTGNYL